MKILFDHQIFSSQKYGGISRYFIEIMKHLPTNIQQEIAIKYSDNEYLKTSGLAPDCQRLFEPYRPMDKMLLGTTFRGKKRLISSLYGKNMGYWIDAHALNKDFSIENLKKQDFDVFHPTYYDDYFLDYIGNKPFILTIHDMIYELYPEMLNNTELSRMKANLAKKAAHIIAVSEKTKQDIIEILGIHQNKITVVYHASSLPKISSIKSKETNKYILFVGERSVYKNFMFFVRSIEQVLKDHSNLNVVCVGRNFSSDETHLLISLNILSRFVVKSVNDEELFALYQNAEVFIFPSYYEGFGIPILEAFQAGCPVILANASCFPEIAKDAALYFNPKSMDEIRSTINEVLNNNDLRKELITKGYERSKSFSWDDSVNKTIKIYESILNTK